MSTRQLFKIIYHVCWWISSLALGAVLYWWGWGAFAVCVLAALFDGVARSAKAFRETLDDE